MSDSILSIIPTIETYIRDGYRVIPVWGKATQCFVGGRMTSRADQTDKAPVGNSWNDPVKRPQASATQLAEFIFMQSGAIGIQMSDDLISLDVDKGAESISVFTELAKKENICYDISDNGIHLFGRITGDYAGKSVSIRGYDITLRTASSRSQVIVAPSNIGGRVRTWGIYTPKSNLRDLSEVFPELRSMSKSTPLIPKSIPEIKVSKPSKPININCPLVKSILANPEKMQTYWANGKGNYFNDLMQVLPMGGNLAGVTQLQVEVERVMEAGGRGDVHKESPEYYAGKEPNCVGLREVCESMGLPQTPCSECPNRATTARGEFLDLSGLIRTAPRQDGSTGIRDCQENYNTLVERFIGDRVKFNEITADVENNLTPTNELAVIYLRTKIEVPTGLSSRYNYQDAFQHVVRKNSYNPVKEMLKSVVWDGTPRLNRILIDLCGTADDEYHQAVSKLIGLGSIWRLYKPGCKVDQTPILVGKQGSGKSVFCELLGFNKYFSDMNDIDSKDAQDKVARTWIAVLTELSAFQTRKGKEALKAFTTATCDTFRPAYGRTTESFPRKCFFIGNTNEDRFLSDVTGERRWWPVRVADKQPVLNMTLEQRIEYMKQFYAEAVIAMNSGEIPYIEGEQLVNTQREIHEESTDVDPYEGTIRAYIDENHLDRICVLQVWVKIFHTSSLDRPVCSRRESNRITGILRRLQWDPVNELFTEAEVGKFSRQRGYRRPQTSENVEERDNLIRLRDHTQKAVANLDNFEDFNFDAAFDEGGVNNGF